MAGLTAALCSIGITGLLRSYGGSNCCPVSATLLRTSCPISSPVRWRWKIGELRIWKENLLSPHSRSDDRSPSTSACASGTIAGAGRARLRQSHRSPKLCPRSRSSITSLSESPRLRNSSRPDRRLRPPARRSRSFPQRPPLRTSNSALCQSGRPWPHTEGRGQKRRERRRPPAR